MKYNIPFFRERAISSLWAISLFVTFSTHAQDCSTCPAGSTLIGSSTGNPETLTISGRYCIPSGNTVTDLTVNGTQIFVFCLGNINKLSLTGSIDSVFNCPNGVIKVVGGVRIGANNRIDNFGRFSGDLTLDGGLFINRPTATTSIGSLQNNGGTIYNIGSLNVNSLVNNSGTVLLGGTNSVINAESITNYASILGRGVVLGNTSFSNYGSISGSIIIPTGIPNPNYGTISTQVTYTQCYPIIVNNPVSQSICPGQSATLSVTTKGVGLTYKWSNGATTPSILVSNAGNYSCTVTGSCGSAVSTNAMVTLLANTAITTQPTGGRICSGNSITLSIVAKGSNLSYLWTNNATTPSITTSTFGNYSCTVTGTCGTVTSNLVSVTPIASITPRIIGQPQSQTICDNSTATLSVSTIGGGSFKWNNGATTKSITTSTPGSYYCVVSSACGSATSSTATVKLKPAPKGVALDFYDFPSWTPTTNFNICPLSNITVSITNPSRYYTETPLYNSLITGVVGGGGGQNGYYQTVTYGTMAGNFAFKFTDPINGCSVTLGKNITLKPLPTLPTFTTSYPSPFCNNSVSTTSVSNPVSYTNFTPTWSIKTGLSNNTGAWTYSETTFIPNSTPITGGYTFKYPGQFRPTPTYLKLSIKDNTTGCTNSSEQALNTTVSPNYPQFTVSASPSAGLCKNTPVTVSTNGLNSSSFTWNFTFPTSSVCNGSINNYCGSPAFVMNFAGISGNVTLTATETGIGCVYSASQAITSGNCRTEEEEENQNASVLSNSAKLSIAPNPATNRAQVFYNLGNQATGVLKVYNVQGSSTVLQQELAGAQGSVELNTENWSSGVYICTVQAGDAVVSMERLVIAK